MKSILDLFRKKDKIIDGKDIGLNQIYLNPSEWPEIISLNKKYKTLKDSPIKNYKKILEVSQNLINTYREKLKIYLEYLTEENDNSLILSGIDEEEIVTETKRAYNRTNKLLRNIIDEDFKIYEDSLKRRGKKGPWSMKN
jgi:hypothetical protein